MKFFCDEGVMLCKEYITTKESRALSEIEYLPLRNHVIKYPLPLKIYVTICNKIGDPLLPSLAVTQFLDGP